MNSADTAAAPPAQAPNPDVLQAQRNKVLGRILWAVGKIVIVALGLTVGIVVGVVVGVLTGVIPFGC